LSEGDQVYVVGKMATVNGEQVLQFSNSQVIGRLAVPLGPMYMNPTAIGGNSLNANTPGVSGMASA
jgi:hypothetical protein